MTGIKYVYSVEMFRNVGTDIDPYYEWTIDFRTYNDMKSLDDEDLKDVPNKRRNSKFVDTYIQGRGEIHRPKLTQK